MTNSNFKENETIEQEETTKSKSQIKREMLSLQKMGERLVDLSDDQIRSIEMPDELKDAVMSVKKLKAHGARKRQLKFIGSLMRKIDTAPVSDALYEIDRGRSLQVSEFHVVEKMRNDLVNGNDDLIEEIVETYSGADRQHLRQLVRNARKELASNKPPKSSRLLFKYIKKLSEERT